MEKVIFQSMRTTENKTRSVSIKGNFSEPFKIFFLLKAQVFVNSEALNKFPLLNDIKIITIIGLQQM